MQRPPARRVFPVLLIVLGLCLIELFSYVFFRSFRDRFTFYELQRFTVGSEEIGRLAEHYDQALGWDNRYDTPHSERPRTFEFNKPLISTFGDSYTHCTDVRDDETWQTYLSELLAADVYNFGTGGYGTDQAYLKFLSVYPRLRTPVVMLGIVTENINRIVNVYRPFYFPQTGIRLPKPRFELAGGRLEMLGNPIKNRDEISLLEDEAFIRSIGKHDWWYNRDNYPLFRFPYTRILCNRRMWLEAFYGKTDREISDIDPRPWENLWKQRQVTDLMFAIVDSFMRSVREYGSVPVVVILPQQDEVFQKFCSARYPKGVEMITDFCERNRCPCFNAIDALAGAVKTREEIPSLFVVHVSAKGNLIIASGLHAFITEHLGDVVTRVHDGR